MDESRFIKMININPTLIENIKIMKKNNEKRKEFSKNTRELFLKEFQVEKSVELLHKYIINN